MQETDMVCDHHLVVTNTKIKLSRIRQTFEEERFELEKKSRSMRGFSSKPEKHEIFHKENADEKMKEREGRGKKKCSSLKQVLLGATRVCKK